MRLSDADLDQLREMEQAATPGPWGTTGHGDVHALGEQVRTSPSESRSLLFEATPDWHGQWDRNARYVVHWRNAAPVLLAELQAARVVVAALRQARGMASAVDAAAQDRDWTTLEYLDTELEKLNEAVIVALDAYAALEGTGDD